MNDNVQSGPYVGHQYADRSERDHQVIQELKLRLAAADATIKQQKSKIEAMQETYAQPRQTIAWVTHRIGMQENLSKHREAVQAILDERHARKVHCSQQTTFYPHGESGTVFVVTEITSWEKADGTQDGDRGNQDR